MKTMYNASGQFYCGDSPGFSCFDAYGFDALDLIDSWSCNNYNDENIDRRSLDTETREYKIYPNPTTGKIKVDKLREGSRLVVYDLDGAVIFDQNDVVTDIDLSAAPSGVYLLMIEDVEVRSFHRVIKL